MNIKQVINFIAGLLSGSIVGAAVVILLAPESGVETRRRITGKVHEIIDAGKQATVERRQELLKQYQDAIQIPLPPAKETE
jgi:gas vesicle protein